MSEVDKELSERYRAVSREEPPAHVDEAILAAAKRAAGAQPQRSGASRGVRRWYVPVSLAAVIMLSVIVTLRIERESPEIAMPDSVTVIREKAKKMEQQAPEPAATPASPPAAVASRLAPKPAPAQPAAPAFAPDPKPARDALPEKTQSQDSLRSTDAARGPAASVEAERGNVAGGAASGRLRNEAREMSAPAPKPDAAPGERQQREDSPRVAQVPRSVAPEMSAPAAKPAPPALAKRELAPEEWLERIAELRTQQRDREADEQLAEFKRRYPDYKIPEAMTERIAPRK